MPVASQWRAHEAPPATVICSAGDRAATEHGAPETAAHDLDACGYCSLLAHWPALNGAPPPDAFLPAARAAETALPAPPLPRPIRYPRRPSRAPPPLA